MKDAALVVVFVVAITLVLAGIGYQMVRVAENSDMQQPSMADSLERFVFASGYDVNETILSSLKLAGDYLVNHITPNDRWDYQYDPENDKVENDYNIIRHAGTTYSLSLLFRYCPDTDYYNGTALTLNYLLRYMKYDTVGGVEIGRIVYSGKSDIGCASLTLMSLIEVCRADPKADYEREISALSDFILMMQKDDGRFQCYYDGHSAERQAEHNDYYPGEALLALSKVHDHTGNEAYLDALEKGFEFYMGYYSDGRYTSYSAWATEAMVYTYGLTSNGSYVDFCYLLADRCLSGQITPDTASEPRFVGGWTPTPASHAASRVEGVMDAYLLAKRISDSSREIQLGRSSSYTAGFLIGLQYNGEDVAAFPSPEKTLGGVPFNYASPSVRIDNVQHAIVVLIKMMVYSGSDNQI